MSTQTIEFAKTWGLIAKRISSVEFRELAETPAFPFDNPNHTILKEPFMYSESDNLSSAKDISGALLYYCVGKPW